MWKIFGVIVVALCIVLLLYFSYLLIFVCRTVTVPAKVISHSTASDKYGEITYYTIVEVKGSLVNKSGLSLYITPVGNWVSLKELDCSCKTE